MVAMANLQRIQGTLFYIKKDIGQAAKTFAVARRSFVEGGCSLGRRKMKGRRRGGG